MYVRTKKGEIFDCYESEQMHKPIYYPKKSKTNGYIDYEDVYKKSDNIIEILEVGDYVNNAQVVGKNENKIIINLLLPFELEEKDIKSIVTKQYFESMKYKVGE